LKEFPPLPGGGGRWRGQEKVDELFPGVDAEILAARRLGHVPQRALVQSCGQGFIFLPFIAFKHAVAVVAGDACGEHASQADADDGSLLMLRGREVFLGRA
jgi:hypothetical protein